MNDTKSKPPLTHLAIIMDGNGRWAKKRGLPRYEGHREGTKVAKKIVEECRKLNIKYLTLYTFSKENWKRPKDEVNFLFKLLVDFLNREYKSLKEQSIKLNILGDYTKLPFAARKAIEFTLKKTKDCNKMVLNLAINYSGRDEIIFAIKKILKQEIDPESLNEESFKDFLYTREQPDPDLIIRTSGEIRLSNYLLYQAAYSELYFTPVLWPDFTEQDLHKALDDFAKRQRRFGGI
ncbi:isoprenyl transferase [Desulfothermus naphthae]